MKGQVSGIGIQNTLFFEAGIVLFLRAMGFCRLTNGVMRIFTDQLNAHISKKALQNNIPILWWPSVSGRTNGAKLRYVEKRFAEQYKGKDNEVFCILTDKEPVRTFVSRELTSQAGKKFYRLYKCRKPVKQFTSTSMTRFLAVPVISKFPPICLFILSSISTAIMLSGWRRTKEDWHTLKETMLSCQWMIQLFCRRLQIR